MPRAVRGSDTPTPTPPDEDDDDAPAPMGDPPLPIQVPPPPEPPPMHVAVHAAARGSIRGRNGDCAPHPADFVPEPARADEQRLIPRRAGRRSMSGIPLQDR